MRDAVKAAIARHNRQQQSRDGDEDELDPPAAAAALEEAQREALFREYVAELSKQQARWVVHVLWDLLVFWDAHSVWECSKKCCHTATMSMPVERLPVVDGLSIKLSGLDNQNCLRGHLINALYFCVYVFVFTSHLAHPCVQQPSCSQPHI